MPNLVNVMTLHVLLLNHYCCCLHNRHRLKAVPITSKVTDFLEAPGSTGDDHFSCEGDPPWACAVLYIGVSLFYRNDGFTGGRRRYFFVVFLFPRRRLRRGHLFLQRPEKVG